MAITKDDVMVRLLLDERDALKSLDLAIGRAETFQEKISEITKFAREMGEQFGVSAQKIVDAFRAVGPESMSKLSKEYRNLFDVTSISVPGMSGFVPQASRMFQSAGFSLLSEDAAQKAANRRLAAEERINAKIKERERYLRDETSALTAQINLFKTQNEKVGAIAQTIMLISKQLKISPINVFDKMFAPLREAGVSVRTLRKVVQKITEEEQKQASLTEARRTTLMQIIVERWKEIAAIKNQGSFLTQVANAEKLINQLVRQTGSNANQVASELKNVFGFSETVISTALNNITQKTKGFWGNVLDVFGNFRSYLSTAFGTFVAMALFQIQMTVSRFFQDTLKQAKEFGNSLYQIKLAEQALSESGIDVTNRQILQVIDNLSELYKTISNQEIRSVFADVALKLRDAKLTLEQLQGITQAILDLKIRNPDKSLGEISDVVTRAILTEEQKALTNMGLPSAEISSDEKLLNYAKQIGLVDELTDKLTEQQKIEARTNYVIQKSVELRKGTLEQQNSLFKADERLQASWDNLIEKTLRLTDYWNSFSIILAITLDMIRNWIDVIQGVKEPTTLLQKLFISIRNIINSFPPIIVRVGEVISFIVNPLHRVYVGLANAKTLWDKFYEAVTGKKISDELDIPKLQEIDTPTRDTSQDEGVLPDTSLEKSKSTRIREMLSELAEALDQFGDRARKAKEDFDLIWNPETGRAWEDYYRDIWEINRDINEKIRDANEKHRKKELDQEAKFLEQLRQLRERFLFSLEDALRERDARQVIRLTKQYEMDKAALIREEQLRKESDEREFSEEMANLEAERAKRLEQLNYEFELKRKREEEDYKISMQRLKEELNDKLVAIANNIAEQLGINEQGAKAIYDVLSQVYGVKGSITSLVNYTYDNMIVKSEDTYKRLLEIYSKYKEIGNTESSSPPSTSTPPSTRGRGRTRQTSPRLPKPPSEGKDFGPIRMASGGAIIANTATDIRFGEAGGEAMFVPINKFVEMFSRPEFRPGGPGNGKLDVRVTISPDLRAEIIQRSLDEFAGVLEVVQREI